VQLRATTLTPHSLAYIAPAPRHLFGDPILLYELHSHLVCEDQPDILCHVFLCVDFGGNRQPVQLLKTIALCVSLLGKLNAALPQFGTDCTSESSSPPLTTTAGSDELPLLVSTSSTSLSRNFLGFLRGWLSCSDCSESSDGSESVFALLCLEDFFFWLRGAGFPFFHFVTFAAWVLGFPDCAFTLWEGMRIEEGWNGVNGLK
jgi:hypothetical protein